MKAEILLVRHAFTPANNARWNNQQGIRETFRCDEDCPIDRKYGITQAEELGAYLKGKLKNKKVAIIMSPYRRVKETISIATKDLDGIDFFEKNSLREINQGVAFANTEEELKKTIGFEADIYYDLIKTSNAPAIEYPYGESEIEVRNRVRNVSQKIHELANKVDEEGNLRYDIVIVAAHDTVNRWVYYWLNNQEILDKKQLTASVIAANGEQKGKTLFTPTTFVPMGYNVNFEDYAIPYFGKLIRDNENLETYKNFCNIDLTSSENQTKKIEKNGFDLYIPTEYSDNFTGYFFVDSKLGHDCYAYDIESTHSYYVLDGNGVFIINGNKIEVEKGSIVVVPPYSTFYYLGKMKMIEKIEPNFKSENFVVVEEVKYDDKKK